MCSSIFEPPPPTAQTEHARDPKFCMVGPRGTRFWATEAIFEFHPRSRDMSRKSTIFESRFDPSKTPKCAHISASRTKFKNRLGGPKSSPLGTYHAKFGISSMFRLGCRGGGSKMLLHILYSEETCTGSIWALLTF